MQCRPGLFALFKCSCLCVPSTLTLPSVFEVSIPTSESDKSMFRSCVRSHQLSYMTIPNVSSLYRDPKTTRRIFRLLGSRPEFLSDKKFHIWNFLKGSSPRRTRIQNKLEEGYEKAILQSERATAASYDTTPTCSRSCSTSSVNSPVLPLERVNVSVVRCSEAGGEGT